MKSKILTIAFMLLLSIVKSQSFEYKNYTWDSIPFFSYNLSNYTEYKAYGLKTKFLLEYSYDDVSGDLYTYVTVHRKYLVLNNDALDELNKIYISMTNVEKLIDIRARFISSDNKVTNLDRKNIKEIKNNDEEKSGYQQFVIEGASTPGIIEYFYVIKKSPQLSGYYYLQTSVPSYNVEFEVYSPASLKLMLKGYNGFKTPVDSLLGKKDKWHYYSKMDSIPAMPSEQYALNDANKHRVEYALAYNYSKNRSRIRSLDQACHTYYSVIFDEENKFEKPLKKTLKEINIKGLDQEKAIRKIEDWAKNNISIADDSPFDANDIQATLKNKFTNSTGLMILIANLCKVAEIPVDIVVTCDKSDRLFDPEFDGWNFLDEVLLYFPDIKKYMQPSEYNYRLGYYDTKFFDNYGVFMSTIVVDKLSSFKYKMKMIPSVPYTLNGDSLLLTAKVNDDMTQLNMKIKKVYSGERATFVQPYFRFMDKTQKDKIIEAFVGLSDIGEIDSYSVSNDNAEDLLVKPFIIEADAHAQVVETAGAKYIVKIGLLIGPQSELYNEKKRVQAVDLESVHYYYRKIIFEIPEGYKVSDVSSLNINVTMNDGSDPSAGFVSSAKIEGNKVIVEVSEFYKKMSYPIESYEAYRSVINAAADFNKRSIVLEKK